MGLDGSRRSSRPIVEGVATSLGSRLPIPPASPAGSAPPDRRPIVLATLSVRVDPQAERLAIATALDQTPPRRLILANMLWLPPHPTTLTLAREHAILPHEEDLEAVRATARRAADAGIPTELLRISSRRPLAALLELVGEREAGLVVLGPDRHRAPRWWVWLAARRVRRRAGCLVWIAGQTSR
jgi:hypothetical protein